MSLLYRLLVSFIYLLAHALFGHLMTSGTTYWNWSPFFDYYDRVKVMVDPAEFSTFFNNMWVAYRGGGGTGFPSAPTNLVATANGNRYIGLTWTDNATNEDYQLLERKVTGGSYSTLAYISPNIVTYTDSSVAPGTSYTYRITAVNGTGSSAASNESVAVTAQAARNLAQRGWHNWLPQ